MSTPGKSGMWFFLIDALRRMETMHQIFTPICNILWDWGVCQETAPIQTLGNIDNSKMCCNVQRCQVRWITWYFILYLTLSFKILTNCILRKERPHWVIKGFIGSRGFTVPTWQCLNLPARCEFAKVTFEKHRVLWEVVNQARDQGKDS